MLRRVRNNPLSRMHPLAPPGETGRGLCVRRISRWRARRRAKVIWAARRGCCSRRADRRRLGRPASVCWAVILFPANCGSLECERLRGAWSSAKTRARWCLCSRARRWSRPSSVARLRYVSRHALPAPARLSACPGCPTPPTRRRGAGIGCAARIVSRADRTLPDLPHATTVGRLPGPRASAHSLPFCTMPVSRAAPQPMSARTSNPRAGLKAAPGAASGFVRVSGGPSDPKTRHGGAVAPPGAAIPAAFRRALRDHAHTRLGVILSLLCPPDIRVPTLSIECAPCGRAGRYNVAKLMEETERGRCRSNLSERLDHGAGERLLGGHVYLLRRT
jgi:hypothetical protein